MSILKPLIIILGPTASGKTEMGLKLAKQFNGEIINADSRQIYEKMLIGTGSPFQDSTTKNNILDSVPHHLFHIINPNQSFSLSEYKKLALEKIEQIQDRENLPIIVGGTGLYISALVDNFEIPAVPPNPEIREKLEKHTEKYLFERLKKLDPESAETIGPRNKRKMIRALEVYEITSKPFSRQQKRGESPFETLQIGIMIDRKELYERIDRRVDEMIAKGLVGETKRLLQKYDQNLPAMSGIGYKEMGQFLRNEITLEEATQKIKFRTHQYARRQMTWFKKDTRINWVESYKDSEKILKKFISR